MSRPSWAPTQGSKHLPTAWRCPQPMPTHPPRNFTRPDFKPLPWASAVTADPQAARQPEPREAPLPLPVFSPLVIRPLLRLLSSRSTKFATLVSLPALVLVLAPVPRSGRHGASLPHLLTHCPQGSRWPPPKPVILHSDSPNEGSRGEPGRGGWEEQKGLANVFLTLPSLALRHFEFLADNTPNPRRPPAPTRVPTERVCLGRRRGDLQRRGSSGNRPHQSAYIWCLSCGNSEYFIFNIWASGGAKLC